MKDLSGDIPCRDCGTESNPVWWVDHDIWNEVVPDDGILCLNCFVQRAGERRWRLTSYDATVVRAGTELYEATGVPAARPAELQDLIEDGWLVRVGEGDNPPSSMMNVGGVTWGDAPDEVGEGTE